MAWLVGRSGRVLTRGQPLAETALCGLAASSTAHQLEPRRGSATHGVGEARPKDVSVQRFYKSVGVQPTPDGKEYQVTLDHRVLKTPAKKPLRVPSEPLAWAIAAEWESQADRVRPFTMPLMTLAATAIDAPVSSARVVETLLQYLPTDGLLCRETPGKLAHLQAEMYDPVLEWARGFLGVKLEPTDSIFGADLPVGDVRAVGAYLSRQDRWRLTAVEHLAAACRSVVLAIAVVERHISVTDALALARLEESAQIAQWGMVEGGHDVDIADAKVRVAAPSVFLRLLDA